MYVIDLHRYMVIQHRYELFYPHIRTQIECLRLVRFVTSKHHTLNPKPLKKLDPQAESLNLKRTQVEMLRFREVYQRGGQGPRHC